MTHKMLNDMFGNFLMISRKLNIYLIKFSKIMNQDNWGLVISYHFNDEKW